MKIEGLKLSVDNVICPACGASLSREEDFVLTQKIPVTWDIKRIEKGKLRVESSYTGHDAEDEDKLYFKCDSSTNGRYCGHTWLAEFLEENDLIEWV